MRGIIVLTAFFLMNCASVAAFGYATQMEKQSVWEVVLISTAE